MRSIHNTALLLWWIWPEWCQIKGRLKVERVGSSCWAESNAPFHCDETVFPFSSHKSFNRTHPTGRIIANRQLSDSKVSSHSQWMIMTSLLLSPHTRSVSLPVPISVGLLWGNLIELRISPQTCHASMKPSLPFIWMFIIMAVSIICLTKKYPDDRKRL